MKQISLKQKVNIIISILFIITGFIVGSIPFLGPIITQQNQNAVIEQYNDNISKMTKTEIDDAKSEFKKYNETGRSNFFNAIENDTVISYIDIPKIDVYLPIYKGTDEETLAKGIGLLENTSFPIGGNGTHTVLTGHSGLTTQTMFSNLEKMAIGDKFYLHTYDEKLCYKVYDIQEVVPDDVSSNIRYDIDHDYCTLMTCTPIGINTHRLLIMAERYDDFENEMTTAEINIERETTVSQDSTTEATYINQKTTTVYDFSMFFCGGMSIILELVGIILLIRGIHDMRQIED